MIGVLAIGGLVLLLWRRLRQVPSSFWWVPALLFLSNLPFIGDARYRSPVDPFLIMLGAVLVDAVLGAVRWKRPRRPVVVA